MCSHEFQTGFCVFVRVARKRCRFAELTSPPKPAELASPPTPLGLSFAFTFAPPQRMLSRAGSVSCSLAHGCHAALASLLGSEIGARTPSLSVFTLVSGSSALFLKFFPGFPPPRNTILFAHGNNASFCVRSRLLLLNDCCP